MFEKKTLEEKQQEETQLKIHIKNKGREINLYPFYIRIISFCHDKHSFLIID